MLKKGFFFQYSMLIFKNDINNSQQATNTYVMHTTFYSYFSITLTGYNNASNVKDKLLRVNIFKMKINVIKQKNRNHFENLRDQKNLSTYLIIFCNVLLNYLSKLVIK